jgi:O-antigen ligase
MAIGLVLPVAVLGDATAPYDDPKAWALTILAGVAGLAWVWGWAGAPPRGSATRPAVSRGTSVLHWAVGAYALWFVVTTAASLMPAQSAWGSFGRGHGLVALGAALLVFALVHAMHRTAAEAAGLLDAVLLGSVPVCLLALGQAAGWDPLPRAWDPSTVRLRVRSTLGQHIFLGSYVAFVAPLAAARLETVWAAWPHGAEGPRPWPRWTALVGAVFVGGVVGLIALAAVWAPGAWALPAWGAAAAVAWTWALGRDRSPTAPGLGLALLGALLAAHLAVLVLSQARGAFLGGLVGLAVTAVGLTWRRRAWRGLLGVGVGLGGVVLFVVLLNVPASPLAPLRTVPPWDRLAQLVESERGTPGWVRLRAWRGIVDGWERQLRGEPVVPETWPRARSLVGYGLESQLSTLDHLTDPFLRLSSSRLEVEGARGRYFLDRAHNDALDHLLTGGLVGVALWLVTLSAVLVTGLQRLRSGDGREGALRLGCLGALTADLVSGLVGIATPTSRALFWLVAGVLTLGVAPGRAVEGRPRAMADRSPWRWTVVAAAALVAVITAVGSTRWLLASTAYGRGVRHLLLAHDSGAARAEFARSSRLAPWAPQGVEALAVLSLRLARESEEPARRARLLQEAREALERARPYVQTLASHWLLSARVARAEAHAHGSAGFTPALEAFAAAARRRPGDARILAEWGLAALEAGQTEPARSLAERAVARNAKEWLGWAVLARAAADLGDPAGSAAASGRARRLVPAEERESAERILP